MSTWTLYSKIEGLPEHLKKQVLDYIEFLLSREVKGPKTQGSETPKPKFKPGLGGEVSFSDKHDKPLQELKDTPLALKKPIKAGFLKGSFVMASDFDEPLEDFKDYM